MPTLGDFYASLKSLCHEIDMLRYSPRPAGGGWQHHGPSVNELRAQKEKCQKAVADSLTLLEAAAARLPAAWRGDDPAQSKYIRLKRGLETVRYWLHEFGRPFRG